MSKDSTLEFLDMGFATATTMAFALPGGPGIAAVLAGTSLIIDLVYPEDEQAFNPDTAAATYDEVKNLMDGLTDDAKKAMRQQQANDQKVMIEALSRQLNGMLKDAKLGLGPTLTGPLSDAITQARSVAYKALTAPALSLDNSNVLEFLVGFESKSQADKFALIGPYTLAAGLFMQLCRLAIAWEATDVMRPYQIEHNKYNDAVHVYKSATLKWNGLNAAEPVLEATIPLKNADQALWDSYNQAKDNFDQAHASWQAKMAKLGQQPTFTMDKPADMPDDLIATLGVNSVFSRKITDNLTRFLKTAKSVQNEMQANFNLRATTIQSKIDKLHSNFKIAEDGSGHWGASVTNTDFEGNPATDYIGSYSSRRELDLQLQNCEQKIKTQYWEPLTNHLNLQNVSSKGIARLNDTIGAWQKIGRSVPDYISKSN